MISASGKEHEKHNKVEPKQIRPYCDSIISNTNYYVLNYIYIIYDIQYYKLNTIFKYIYTKY